MASKLMLENMPRENRLRKLLSSEIVAYLLAIVVAFIVSGIFIALMGYDVLEAYRTIFSTSFRTPFGFIQTLLKWIPLTLLALSFTVPMATGKFNIGGGGPPRIGGNWGGGVGRLF